MFCKRWKEHRDKQAPPRVELNKGPQSEPMSSALWNPTEANWESAVSFYARTGRWSAQFGPAPGSRACKCPIAILEKHGIDPETGDERRVRSRSTEVGPQ
jgi:hypothetical protein